MKRLMHWIMLSCRKATELIEKNLLVGLSRKERMQLSLHTSMCKYCARYEKQSSELNDFIKEGLNNETLNAADESDIEHLKIRIQSKLQ